jgi:hypothetical protein
MSDPKPCIVCLGVGDCAACKGVGCDECCYEGECPWCKGTGHEDEEEGDDE